jgi:hypothetical protein
MTLSNLEIEYLKRFKVPFKVISGWYLYIPTKRRPYHKICGKLYQEKQEYKNADKRRYMLAKTLLNSFYGKMIQTVEKPDGTYKAGSGFNPIYAALITSQVRVKLCDICNDYKSDILAVHADSILTTKELSKKQIGENMGEWGLKTSGRGVIVACGMYQINDTVAYRGLDKLDSFNWIEALKKAGSSGEIGLTAKRVMSWVSALNLNRIDDINKFIDTYKIIRLNCDIKRVWPERTNGKKLLSGLQDSLPRLHVEPFNGKRGVKNGINDH